MSRFKTQLNHLAASRPGFSGTLLLLLLATIVPYLNTLHVPWYYDDINNIIDNPLVRDLPAAARGLLENRGIAIFTFALNYRFGGLDPSGYHLVNLAIHAGSVIVVWLLLRRLFEPSSLWAVPGAILFALHPLQTQAVTYVVQRMTCLAGFFFFLSVYLYLKARERRPATVGEPPGFNFFYLAAILSGAVAVLVKQNAAILPVALLLIDYYFLPTGTLDSLRKRCFYLLPFFLAPLWLTTQELVFPLLRGGEIWQVANPTSHLHVSIPRYLATEFSVMWLYIRLLFLPVGQVFDYSYPVVETLLAWKNVIALLGLGGLLGLAFNWREKYPFLSFGIFWFFLTLSIESTFIPLDPVNEHRLYVPIFGFVLLVIELLRRLPRPSLQLPLMVVLLAVLALLTWQRNGDWADPVALLEDNLKSAPGNVRVMVMLGNAYAAAQRPEEGLQLIGQAMAIDRTYVFVYTAMAKILIDQGKGAQAIAPLQQGVQIHPRSATLHEYLGIVYAEAGDYQQALNYFRRAAVLEPDDASVYTNIGLVYVRLGDDRQALDSFKRSLALAPESQMAADYYNATLSRLSAEGQDAVRPPPDAKERIENSTGTARKDER